MSKIGMKTKGGTSSHVPSNRTTGSKTTVDSGSKMPSPNSVAKASVKTSTYWGK